MQGQVVLVVAVLDNINLLLDAASVQVDVLSQALGFFLQVDSLSYLVLVGQLRYEGAEPLWDVGFVVIVEKGHEKFVDCGPGIEGLFGVQRG